MTQLSPARSEAAPGCQDGLFHWYDDDPNVALCGTDLTHYPEGDPDGDDMCIVCAYLDEVLP